jgi:hypothetical protein
LLFSPVFLYKPERLGKRSALLASSFLLGLFLSPEDGDIFHWNISWLSTDYWAS